MKYGDIKKLISKEMAYRVYDEFENEEIIKKDDGNFLVNVEGVSRK